jgi:CBS domain-containing protein
VKEVEVPGRRRVGSVMTTDVATVGPDTPFKAVAVLLASWSVSGAPVVDEDGRVLGVVSQGDLLEREAPHGLLEPGSRQARRKADAVFVADGVVTLSGVIDRRTEAERAEWLTGAVPGVVAVRNRLKYTQDDGVAAEPR